MGDEDESEATAETAARVERQRLAKRVAELERQNGDLQATNNLYLVRARTADGVWRAVQASLDARRPTLSGPDYGMASEAERREMRFLDLLLDEIQVALDKAAARGEKGAATVAYRILRGDPIRKIGGEHEVDGFLAGVVDWAGVEHPVMAIPVAKGFLLHIYAWSQLARRALGR